MTRRGTIAALGALIVATACSGQTAGDAKGRVQVRVDALTASYQITRIALDIQPAGTGQDLAYDAGSGTFSGYLVVPAGIQTFTATAWAGEQAVGAGSTTAEIAGGATSYVYLTILDTTGPPPAPDHAPVITSFVVSSTRVQTGEHVTLSASALDVDGDPLAFRWSQSCGGTFADASAASTEWWSDAPGTCTLTLVVTAGPLVDVASVSVLAVDGTVGDVYVNGRYVSNPTVQSMSISSYWSGRWLDRNGANVEAGTFPIGDPVTVYVAFDLGTYSPGAYWPSLTDDCGGTARLDYFWTSYAYFTWTPPARAGACVLTATIDHEGLRDSMPAVAIVEPCSPTLACGGNASCQDGTCVVARTVSGQMVTTYWDGTTPTTTMASPDVSSLAVEALVPLAGGGFAYYGGQVDPWNGQLSISGLPQGRYLLALTNTWSGIRTVIDTSADWIDLGRDELGRANKSFPQNPTPVTFDIAGLDPWTGVDELQLTSIDAGLWDPASYRWAIADGATDVHVSEDWQYNLVDANQGDVLYVHQLASRPAPGVPGTYVTAVAGQELTGVVVGDGIPSTVTALLTPIAQSRTADIAWSPSQFEQFLPDMGPAGVYAGTHTLYIDATPGTTAFPSPLATYGTPDLAIASLEAGAPDVSTTLQYGEPPQGWNEFRQAGFTAYKEVFAPGATSPRYLPASLFSQEPLPAFPTVAPRISPVRSPQISGLDLTGGDVAGAGLEPVLSWAAPALGAADKYAVNVYELWADAAGRSRSRLLGTVHTRNTSVALPFPFQWGASYFARITARAEPGANVEGAPFRAGYDLGAASRVTAVWTP